MERACLMAQARRLGASLSSEDVLKMLTSVPAQLLGVEDRIGSLTEGKDADIVIWSGNPLETFRALPEIVVISRGNSKGGTGVMKRWIRGARIFTMGPQGTLEKGDILIENGKIAAIGEQLDCEDAEGHRRCGTDCHSGHCRRA